MTNRVNPAEADQAYESAYGHLADAGGPATVLRLALADPDRVAEHLPAAVTAATEPTHHAVLIAEGNAGRSAAIIARLEVLSASMLIHRTLDDLARLGARAGEFNLPSRWLFNVDGAGLAWPGDGWHPAIRARFCFDERPFSAELERVHQKWLSVFASGPAADWCSFSPAAVDELPVMADTERRLTALSLVRLLAAGETVLVKARQGGGRPRWRSLRADALMALPESWRGPLAG